MKNSVFLPAPPLTNLPLGNKPKHHSVSDWDHTGGTVFILDTAQYVSAPRSLRIGGSGAAGLHIIFICRIGNTLNLPQGRLVFHHRSSTDVWARRLQLRNQSPLGTASRDNTYEVEVTNAWWALDRRVSGSPTPLGTYPMTTEIDTWYHDRITWWNGVDPYAREALVVMYERYIAEAWVKQGDWLFDIVNQWKNSDTNRTGIGNFQVETGYVWHDNTEIWGPS